MHITLIPYKNWNSAIALSSVGVTSQPVKANVSVSISFLPSCAAALTSCFTGTTVKNLLQSQSIPGICSYS